MAWTSGGAFPRMATHRIAKLRPNDIKTAYMLLGGCRELGRNPEAWCRRLGDGLSGHMGIRLSAFVEGGPGLASGQGQASPGDRFFLHGPDMDKVLAVFQEFWAREVASRDPTLIAWRKVRNRTAVRARSQLIDMRDWYASDSYRMLFQRLGLDHAILCRCPIGDSRMLMMDFWRQAGDRDFTTREIGFLELVTREVGTLARDGALVPLGGRRTGLPPRLQQVLEALRQGMSEKEVAAALGLSPHTVHNHVKRLHRRFGVANRAALLAAISQEPDGTDPRASGRFESVLPPGPPD